MRTSTGIERLALHSPYSESAGGGGLDMTKKHFIALADVMRDIKPREENKAAMEQWTDTCSAMATWCRGESGAFNTRRWFGYIDGTCGPYGGTK